MNVKIVLVRPLYEENVGYIARLAANFKVGEIALVRPRCNWRTGKAKSRAMHGKGILLEAKKFGSLERALQGCTYSIATTALLGKGKKLRRNAIGVEQFAKRFAASKGKIALVFGPEPSGLSNEEIGQCDFIVSISASRKYRTLNIGHAAAILLYSLFAAKQGKGKKKAIREEARPGTKKLLNRKFGGILEKLPGIENKKAVLLSFKALTSRALLTEKEAKALLAFLSETGKMKGKKGKNQ